MNVIADMHEAEAGNHIKETGEYLVIEGPEAVGKTTQVKKLVGRLALMGYEVSDDIREPGGTPMAEAIRNVLKNKDLERSPETNLYLFNAARLETLRLIQERTDSGTWVVCDRNYLSSMAYQLEAEGADPDMFHATTEPVISRFRHGLELILMTSETEQARRLSLRGDDDYFQSQDEQFHKRVRQGYLKAARQRGIPVINGEGSEEEVHERIWQYVKPKTNEIGG